jgi:hypothetical protein
MVEIWGAGCGGQLFGVTVTLAIIVGTNKIFRLSCLALWCLQQVKAINGNFQVRGVTNKIMILSLF